MRLESYYNIWPWSLPWQPVFPIQRVKKILSPSDRIGKKDRVDIHKSELYNDRKMYTTDIFVSTKIRCHCFTIQINVVRHS